MQQYQSVEEFEGMQRGALAGIVMWPDAEEAIPAVRNMTLSDLADGPYFTIVAQLGPEALARVDAACRLTRELNRSHGGPWFHLGRRAFHGLELDRDGRFDGAEGQGKGASAGGTHTSSSRQSTSKEDIEIDWKE